MTTQRFQFAWWWGRRGWATPRAFIWKLPPYPNAPGKDYHGSIYAWRVCVGPLEIRKWGKSALGGMNGQ